MRSILSVAILSCLCLLPLGAAKKKPPVMEIGTVLAQGLDSQDGGAYAMPLGNGTVAVPIRRTTNAVKIQSGEYIFDWVEDGRTLLIFTVNDEFEFYRDGDKFIVLDSKNKKHKFIAIGITRRKAPARP